MTTRDPSSRPFTRIGCGLLLLLAGVSARADSDLGGAFQLVDQHGKAVTEANYLGKPALIYFGFSYCGHICPTDLARMGAATRSLAATRGIRVTPIFITIDPERDTPERLATYVAVFDPNFVGLTGSAEAIADVADKYAVYYAPVPGGESYVMDHSTFTFLIDAEGRYVAHFGRDVSAPELVDAVGRLLEARTVPARQ